MAKKIVNAALESRVNAIVSRHAERAALVEEGDPQGRQFHFVNESDDEASLYIYDQISSWWGVNANDFAVALNDIEAKTLNVHVNSPGGSVFEGFAIYSALIDFANKKAATINVIIDGWAASIASVISMAGDHISIGEHASLMIHKPMSAVWGNADEMREEAEVLDEIEEAIIDIYVARTDGDRAQIQKWVAAETWFRGKKAVDEGFADEVVPLKKKKGDDDDAEDRTAKPAASKGAAYFASIFPNMPNEVREALTEQPAANQNTTEKTPPEDKRGVARVLREAGFSRDAADSIAAHGFKPKTEPRDGADRIEEPTTAEPRDGAEERDDLLATIRHASTLSALRAA